MPAEEGGARIQPQANGRVSEEEERGALPAAQLIGILLSGLSESHRSILALRANHFKT